MPEVRVSGVLQLTKTRPPVTKNFPHRRLFPSDAMMTPRFYTPYDVKCTNLHILTARGMSHILTRIGQLWSLRKNSYLLVQSPNPKNYESEDHRLQYYRIKRRRKFHFLGTLRAPKGFILIRHKRYQMYFCLQLSGSIESFVWKPAHFEFWSYSGAWQSVKIALSKNVHFSADS